MSKKHKTSIKYLIVFALIFIALMLIAETTRAKELPEIVSPSELSTSWSGKRVTIFGYARSCEALQGRMGSHYLKCLVGTGLRDVAVYVPFQLFNVVGEQVIVQGKYRDHGRYGGHLASHFIVADLFIRDWGKQK